MGCIIRLFEVSFYNTVELSIAEALNAGSTGTVQDIL